MPPRVSPAYPVSLAIVVRTTALDPTCRDRRVIVPISRPRVRGPLSPPGTDPARPTTAHRNRPPRHGPRSPDGRPIAPKLPPRVSAHRRDTPHRTAPRPDTARISSHRSGINPRAARPCLRHSIRRTAPASSHASNVPARHHSTLARRHSTPTRHHTVPARHHNLLAKPPNLLARQDTVPARRHNVPARHRNLLALQHTVPARHHTIQAWHHSIPARNRRPLARRHNSQLVHPAAQASHRVLRHTAPRVAPHRRSNAARLAPARARASSRSNSIPLVPVPLNVLANFRNSSAPARAPAVQVSSRNSSAPARGPTVRVSSRNSSGPAPDRTGSLRAGPGRTHRASSLSNDRSRRTGGSPEPFRARHGPIRSAGAGRSTRHRARVFPECPPRISHGMGGEQGPDRASVDGSRTVLPPVAIGRRSGRRSSPGRRR